MDAATETFKFLTKVSLFEFWMETNWSDCSKIFSGNPYPSLPANISYKKTIIQRNQNIYLPNINTVLEVGLKSDISTVGYFDWLAREDTIVQWLFFNLEKEDSSQSI